MIEFFESLRKIEIIMMKELGPKLHEVGLSRTEIFILVRLYYKKEARMSDLARTAGIPASSFTSIIDRLVKRNLVTRENDPNDRRSILLHGTPELNEKVKQIFSIGNEVFAEVLEPVPESLLARVTADLNKLYDYISNEDHDGYTVNK